MIFAAGMGTRLQPLTFTKPKALVEVGGIPLLEIIIRRLIKFGFTDLVINVHHFSNQILDFLAANNNFGVSITISDETGLLLDTGGGLLNARSFFGTDEPFLVHNVDILSDLDINKLYEYHLAHNSLATMAVKDRNTSRSLLINSNDELCGWKNNQSGKTIISKGSESELSKIAFSGVHVVSPRIFPLITESGVFSIMDTYLRLAQSQKIITWSHNQNFWMDMGKVENLKEAEKYLNLL